MLTSNQKDAISQAIEIVTVDELKTAVESASKVINGGCITDNDEKINFRNVSGAILEPNMFDYEYVSYENYVNNDVNTWLKDIEADFGKDWFLIAMATATDNVFAHNSNR